MKKLKFLIVVLGLFAAQGAMAVTLPSTSYTPYSQTGDYTSGVTPSGVSVPSSKFLSLGADGDESEFEACVTSNPGPENILACQNCVRDQYKACEAKCSGNFDCIMECAQLSQKYQGDCGRSLPLDAPLWFMLVIAVLSVTLRAYARRVSQAA